MAKLWSGSPTLKGLDDRILTRFCLASPRRKLAVVVLAGLVLGSFGYSFSAYPQLRNWMVSNPVLEGLYGMLSAPSGIKGSIAYDRGAVSCRYSFPDPQGSVLVQGPDGKIVQVSVEWTFTKCDLKTGVFQVLVPPGRYHVSFTGYPLTLPPNGEIGGTNLPLSITVQRHQLTQIEIGISHGV